MGIFHRISEWWNRDREEIGEEEAEMSQGQRDVAEEDYESRKDDLRAREQWASGAGAGGADFERDSEGPQKY